MSNNYSDTDCLCSVSQKLRAKAQELARKNTEYEKEHSLTARKINSKTWVLRKPEAQGKDYEKREDRKITKSCAKIVVILDTKTRREHVYDSIKAFADDIKANYGTVYHYITKHGCYLNYSLL